MLVTCGWLNRFSNLDRKIAVTNISFNIRPYHHAMMRVIDTDDPRSYRGGKVFNRFDGVVRRIYFHWLKEMNFTFLLAQQNSWPLNPREFPASGRT